MDYCKKQNDIHERVDWSPELRDFSPQERRNCGNVQNDEGLSSGQQPEKIPGSKVGQENRRTAYLNCQDNWMQRREGDSDRREGVVHRGEGFLECVLHLAEKRCHYRGDAECQEAVQSKQSHGQLERVSIRHRIGEKRDKDREHNDCYYEEVALFFWRHGERLISGTYSVCCCV